MTAFPEAVMGHYWGKKARVLLALPPWHQRQTMKGTTSWVDECLDFLPQSPSSLSLSEIPTTKSWNKFQIFQRSIMIFFFLSLKILLLPTRLNSILKFSVCQKDPGHYARGQPPCTGGLGGEAHEICLFSLPITRGIGTHYDSDSFVPFQISGGSKRSIKRRRGRRGRENSTVPW